MIHMKNKPQLMGFLTLVLSHSVVLLLLTHCCGGQSQVIGASQPVVAMVGDDTVLPCRLEPAVDARDLTVEWARPDLDPRFVHLRRDGVELQLEGHPLYKGRTSLSLNKLKCGDISLKISKVKPSDAGTYKCLVLEFGAETVIELAVGSVSSPEMKISKVSSGVMLDCRSRGWYPEPEVLWLDAEGNLLSAGPTETVRGPDDLYTVSSRVTVEKRHSNSFTCRVQQKNINQTREAHIHVPDDLLMVQSSPAVRITICLIVCFMFVVAVVVVLWKWGQNKTRTKRQHEDGTTSSHDIELQHLMEGERDRHTPDEQLEKTEEELKHVQQLIETLKEQKMDLKNQKEKLISLQQDDKTQEEEIKKKMKTNPKMDKDKKMQKREKTKEDLEKRKTEHKELLENTDKLLDTTEGLIIKMTERRAKLEKDKEQINKYLKHTKRQKEELQKKLKSEQQEREEKGNDPSSDDATQPGNI